MCEQLFTLNFFIATMFAVVVIGLLAEHIVEIAVKSKQDKPS
jgi:hypothetical protein